MSGTISPLDAVMAAYKIGPRFQLHHLPTPRDREPPDRFVLLLLLRCKLSDVDHHPAFANPDATLTISPPDLSVTPDIGGGDKGVSDEDATRPKPIDGRSKGRADKEPDAAFAPEVQHDLPTIKKYFRMLIDVASEDAEESGVAEVDQSLSEHVKTIRLNLSKEQPECSKVQELASQFEKSAGKAGHAKTSRVKKCAGKPPAKKHELETEPTRSMHRSDMIPALKELSNTAASLGSKDTELTAADSVIGKCTTAAKEHTKNHKIQDKTLVLFEKGVAGGDLKRGRVVVDRRMSAGIEDQTMQ